MTESTDPRRLRWSVPAADVSTNRWLDAQADISLSLRALIRESIEREGYVDVYNKPVEQLPRRGRPPQSESSEQGRPSREETTGGVDAESGDSLEPRTHDKDFSGTRSDPTIEHEAAGADESEGSSADAAASERPADGPTVETVVPAEEPGTPEAAEPQRKQQSIDEIMASTRR